MKATKEGKARRGSIRDSLIGEESEEEPLRLEPLTPASKGSARAALFSGKSSKEAKSAVY